MVVLEAWAYAKPVLMTPECNLPEGFAANAANAIGTDAPGIARGLAEFLPAQSAALAELGANGQRLIATKFTWEAVAAETKAVYEALLGGGSLPACVETG
jgi:poly(glycerol-phosphate) alpha-glucosyltransferase